MQGVHLMGRIAERSVQAVAGALNGRPVTVRPSLVSSALLFTGYLIHRLLAQLMANGNAENSRKVAQNMGSGAKGLIGRISVGIAALPVPKYPLMCLRPLPTEAWYPPKECYPRMACNNDIMRGMGEL